MKHCMLKVESIIYTVLKKKRKGKEKIGENFFFNFLLMTDCVMYGKYVPGDLCYSV